MVGTSRKLWHRFVCNLVSCCSHTVWTSDSKTTTKRGLAKALVVCNHSTRSPFKKEETMVKGKFLNGGRFIFFGCNILMTATMNNV